MAPKGGTDVEKTNDKKLDDKKNIKDAKEDFPEDTDLSEEDQQLKDELTLCVTRLTESDETLYKSSLEILRTKIRSSTSSLTSVPKPLKFLREHFEALSECFEKITEKETKMLCGDVLSCLAMVMSEKRDCLRFRLAGSDEDIGDWGHEYVRHLAGEVAAEWTDMVAENPEFDTGALLKLVKKIVPYDMLHNSETDAADLLMEIERLDLLVEAADLKSYKKVTHYLKSCVPYTPDPENTTLMRTALAIYLKFEKYCEAMFVGLQLNEDEIIEDIFTKCTDLPMRKQLSYILGRQQRYLELGDDIAEAEDLQEIMSNSHLNTNFLALARELDIMEPKKTRRYL